LGPKYVAVLEKAFGVFYSAGLSLGFFLRHHELLHSSEELQLIMAASFTDLLKLVTGISIYYTRKELRMCSHNSSVGYMLTDPRRYFQCP
jgi:hypothetical protein